MIPQRLPPRIARTVAVAIVVLGAALRLRQYLAVRSLWLDEASLALNIASRSYGGLAKPLDLAQVAPIPYLWIERLFCDLFSVNELALRAPALLAGIALPWVVWRVARKVLDDVPALIASALVTVAPTLIYYSNEVKPYAIDALVATVFALLTLRVIEAPAQRSRWLAFVLGGALGVAVSFPTVLVFPAAMIALVLSNDVRRAPRFWGLAIGAGAILAVAFVISYGSVQGAASSDYLQHYWEGMFFSLREPGRLWTGLAEALQQALVGSPDIPERKLQVALLLSLCVVGAVSLIRRQRSWAVVLLGLPLLTVFTATVFQRYPFAARTTLFAVPMLFVLLAAAVSAAVSSRVSAGLAFGLLLLVPGVWTDAQRFTQPKRREDTRPVYQKLEAARSAGEPLYVYARTIPVWAIYSTNWRTPDRDRLAFITEAATVSTRQLPGWALTDAGTPVSRKAFPGGMHPATYEGPSFENARSRHRPVEREGDELIWKTARGPELLGLATGVNLRPNTPPERKTPDEGWAQNEARRLSAAGSPTAWLFFSHIVDGADSHLLETLTAKGGAVLQAIRADDAVAYRVQLPAKAAERRAEESNLTP